jgi:hypothetical protein
MKTEVKLTRVQELYGLLSEMERVELYTLCNNDSRLSGCYLLLKDRPEDKGKLLYEWVKTDHINLKEFTFLMEND